jgi:hypothetical protein
MNLSKSFLGKSLSFKHSIVNEQCWLEQSEPTNTLFVLTEATPLLLIGYQYHLITIIITITKYITLHVK